MLLMISYNIKYNYIYLYGENHGTEPDIVSII